MSDRTSNRITLAEWREKELTYVIGALATALELEDDEQRDALCDIREWAKNRLKAQLPDETPAPTGYTADLIRAIEHLAFQYRLNQNVAGTLQQAADEIKRLSAVEPTPRHLTESERASFERALRNSTRVVHEGELAPEKAKAVHGCPGCGCTCGSCDSGAEHDPDCPGPYAEGFVPRVAAKARREHQLRKTRYCDYDMCPHVFDPAHSNNDH